MKSQLAGDLLTAAMVARVFAGDAWHLLRRAAAATVRIGLSQQPAPPRRPGGAPGRRRVGGMR
ncbi:hypothetical protein [Streptomyces hiroshimensis]|uniref:hypothetical protein n=1 Tax=Streptomyces hiroshimensis TaxID=66424 RepID=UPI001676C357|nr:hypothetical protein [Streptomyces hiroshimensis]